MIYTYRDAYLAENKNTHLSEMLTDFIYIDKYKMKHTLNYHFTDMIPGP